MRIPPEHEELTETPECRGEASWSNRHERRGDVLWWRECGRGVRIWGCRLGFRSDEGGSTSILFTT